MNNKNLKTRRNASESEEALRAELYKMFNNSPIPSNELITNLSLYLKRQDLSQILFMNHLYKKILNVHGNIFEFGVRWGRNLALYSNLRGVYEPFNHNRKIVGFDTFDGFESIDSKDGKGSAIEKGAFNVSDNYIEYLKPLLDYHEKENPIPHIKKYELIKGDATKTIKSYLKNNEHTVIALAYFDFDIYKPTFDCLEAIKDRLTKGSVVGFDELNYEAYPGETLALKEVFGLNKINLKRTPYSGVQSYFVID